MASLKLLPVWSGPPVKVLGVVDNTQCFAPIFNDDSLANLVKSLVKHRGRVFRRITLRNFSREEFFSSALKIFVSLSLVVRHLLPPNGRAMSSAVKR
jgi:hypothetical protein